MTAQPPKGCVIAAPHSGAGKTLVTLGLLRAFARAGYPVSGAKVGPDYIDPAFHALACGEPCVNLDIWAMGPDAVRRLASDIRRNLVIEGVMGLFDGADDGWGSTADVAASLGLPVVLVVDARSQGASAAALLHGFKTFRADITIAGVIFNRVASARHGRLLAEAAAKAGLPVLGLLPREDALSMPSRHLGLVQASEQAGIGTAIGKAADFIAAHADLARIEALSAPLAPFDREGAVMPCRLPPLGQRIALARDRAFGFAYPHMLDGWYEAGAEIVPFSPLADEAPDEAADAVFLPGGYPELYAGRLAGNGVFLGGLRMAAARGALIYGECGGFMAMGEILIDGDGAAHAMAGLLPVATSFAAPVRALGYRRLEHESPLPWPRMLRGHEFHYSTLSMTGPGTPLFRAANARGEEQAAMGLCQGNVMGSYAHVISRDWRAGA